MKKIILILVVILIGYIIMEKGNAYQIPSDLIRLRVVANSDSEKDQNIKKEVSKVVQERLYNLLKNIKGKQQAKKLIKANINLIDNDIEETMNNLNSNQDYKVSYGMNYFPEKSYKGIIYDEGEYESLLVTLGEGQGKNWWCILFPPLCLLEEEESTEVEYKFFVKEMIDKYL